jgi:hypothetical protein
MWKHGAYEGLTKEFTTIDDLIDDLMEKQARLSALLDRVRDVREAMMLVSLHSQNAARPGLPSGGASPPAVWAGGPARYVPDNGTPLPSPFSTN